MCIFLCFRFGFWLSSFLVGRVCQFPRFPDVPPLPYWVPGQRCSPFLRRGFLLLDRTSVRVPVSLSVPWNTSLKDVVSCLWCNVPFLWACRRRGTPLNRVFHNPERSLWPFPCYRKRPRSIGHADVRIARSWASTVCMPVVRNIRHRVNPSVRKHR